MYILAIDQGTTGSTVSILNNGGGSVAKANEEYPQIFPKPGWVEHNPEDIWKSVLSSLEKALKIGHVRPQEIAAIGITNQREEFKRGFVRMALSTQAPIIPTLVIGAEESNINLSQLKFTKFLKGIVLPLPLNVIPLPVKWKVKFLPPIYLPYSAKSLDDRELLVEIADEIQEKMQDELREEVLKRGLKYF